MIRPIKTLTLAAVVALASAGPLRAQSAFTFEATFGYAGVGGDLGEVLTGGWLGEGNIDYQNGAFRYGAGVELVSFEVDRQFADESVSKVGFHAYVGYVFPTGGRLKPYIEGRIGSLRLKPEGETFAPPDTLPVPPEEEDENKAPRVDGFEGGAAAGVELALGRKVFLDFHGLFSFLSTDDVDLTAIGLGNVSSGTSWSVRLGLRWNP